MSEAFRVFVVDDDFFVLELINGILETECVVETFASAEECLARLGTQKPDMFLLDVRLPGMDGYVFCRQIKDDPRLRRIPVTFISGHDTIEARLKGYDAGGEDFIVKPFAAEEVLRKVHVAQQIAHGQRSLTLQLEDAELLSSLVMANMDEYAILVRFMRELIVWESDREVATGVLEMLQRYRLAGVVQTRIAQSAHTLSAQGINLPLETSVLEHVRGMGRIFEFRSRSVHNFERLTLMINNMPVHDPEGCGRLRDHLCIAAECADSRLKALEIEERNRRNQSGIHEAIEHIGASISHARSNYLHNRTACTELLIALDQNFARVFAHLEMSNSDELTLTNLVSSFSKDLLKLLDSGEESQQAMEELGKHLRLLNGSS